MKRSGMRGFATLQSAIPAFGLAAIHAGYGAICSPP